MKKLTARAIFAIVLNSLICTIASATTYEIPANSNIIGEKKIVTTNRNSSMFDIATQFDMGMLELLEANPGLKQNKTVPAGTKVVIPSEFILPSAPREGIVLNLAELRIYFYHPNSNLVSTFPVGIGRLGWKTPVTSTKIVKKRPHPSWCPPASIRAASARKGKILPSYMPPGPHNPLGKFAMNLALNGYLIHGTNQPTSVGLRSSSGCIRMYAPDIEELFNLSKEGTSVRFVHEPFKVGSKNNQVYLEAHRPLQEPYYAAHTNSNEKVKSDIQSKSSSSVNWQQVSREMQASAGYPVLVGS